MKQSKNYFPFTIFIALAILFSVDTLAQVRLFGDRGGGRGDFNRGHSYRFNSGSRSFINVGITNRPNYYPAYRPYYRRPYAYSHFGPSFGFRLNVLPFGYSNFYLGNNPYYYNEGIYYRPYNNGGYEVVAPPLGATVKHLPSGTTVTVINGQKFYELGGTFYQEQITSKNKLQYVVVGTDGVIDTFEQDKIQDQAQTSPQQNMQPANSAVKINQLPANSKAVVINQQKYFMSPSGVYYQESFDANNKVSYQAVGSGESDTDN